MFCGEYEKHRRTAIDFMSYITYNLKCGIKSGEKMFHIEFYETETGARPIEEFLESLPPKLAGKALRDIDILADLGNGLREPYSKHLKDGVFELRTQFAGEITRIFYFFYIGSKIVLTNGFIKKTQKTPPDELAKALKYKQDFERRKLK